jgi:hypothetical protein
LEGNFGQTYDSLNQSIRSLDKEFSAKIDIKVGGRSVDEWWADREWEEALGSKAGGRTGESPRE